MLQQTCPAASRSAAARPAASDRKPNRAADGGEAVAPIRQTVSNWALETLVATYGGNTHQLLTDLADYLEASVAYVDRATVEAHLERSLSDHDWAAVATQVTAMAFDEHIGDAGTLRTDWIDDRLSRAGVPGRGVPAAPPRSSMSRQSRPR